MASNEIDGTGRDGRDTGRAGEGVGADAPDGAGTPEATGGNVPDEGTAGDAAPDPAQDDPDTFARDEERASDANGPVDVAEGEEAPAPEEVAAAETDEAGRRRLRSILESLLFAAGDPVPLGRLAAVVPGFTRKEVRAGLARLAEEYDGDDRGFRLHEVAGGWQLRSASVNAPYVRKILEQKPVRLSRAAVETLAIVAYREPVTRAEIEAIRGVNDAAPVVATLLDRALVRVVGRKDVPGRPILYATTPEFLEVFGLRDLGALPSLESIGEAADALDRRAARAAEEVGEGEAGGDPRGSGLDAVGEADEPEADEPEADEEGVGDPGDEPGAAAADDAADGDGERPAPVDDAPEDEPRDGD